MKVRDDRALVEKLNTSGNINVMYARPSRNIYTILEEPKGDEQLEPPPVAKTSLLSDGTNRRTRPLPSRYGQYRMGRPNPQYGGESSRHGINSSQNDIEMGSMRSSTAQTPQTGGDAHRDERDDPVRAWNRVRDKLHQDSSGEDEGFGSSEDDIPGWRGILAACLCCCYCKRQDPCDW